LGCKVESIFPKEMERLDLSSRIEEYYGKENQKLMLIRFSS